jgi:hypothetical protein
MRKLVVLFMALLSGISKAEGIKLGSDDDLIRQMLFASQSLKEQVKNAHHDGTPGPVQTIADASKLVDSGKKDEAIALLRGILNNPKLETRIQLWVWSALRELGQTPDPKSAYEVLGAIIEFPSGGGYDTLAAYVDGSARYLNFSGAAIFWDADDPTIKAMCQALVDSTIAVSSRAKPRSSLLLPKGTAQVTMLTRSGPFVVVSPPDSVIGPGAALMMELMKRSKEKKGEPGGAANGSQPIRSETNTISSAAGSRH